MIKNVVFDMGGVLIGYDVRATFGKYLSDPADIDRMVRDVIGSEEWRMYDRGVISKEDEAHAIMARLPDRLAQVVQKLVLDQVWAANEMPPYPEMLELVKKLKAAGYRLLLLSNAGYDFAQYSVNIPALSYMDDKFVSCYYHLLKPEPEIYQKFFEVFDVDPSQSVFIDDVKANTDASVLCGMDAICYSPMRAPVTVLEDELRARGLSF